MEVGEIAEFRSSYIYMNCQGNKSITFNNTIPNIYSKLKVNVSGTRNSKYGTYYVFRFTLGSSNTLDSIRGFKNTIANYLIINYGNNPPLNKNVSRTTLTFDLKNVLQEKFYLGIQNCDTDAYVYSIQFTN